MKSPSSHGSGVRQPTPIKVAIIGAGPSGFYAAVELFRDRRVVAEVDMFDRLPTPFGLVRHGVAPDHQNIKAVTRKYTKEVDQRAIRYRLFGNVAVGTDVSVSELLTRYHAVILAFGASQSRRLGIPGEDKHGVLGASDIVAWYNGHPDAAAAPPPLDTERVVVIGNGNVAIDIARILTKHPDELAETDLASHALDALRRSRVKEVLVLGRSGPAQASFTPEELRELTTLEGVDLVVPPAERVLDQTTLNRRERGELDPRCERNLQTLLVDAQLESSPNRRTIRLRFLSSPIEVLGGDRVEGIRVRRNAISIDDDGRAHLTPTTVVEDIQCGAIVRSVGYEVSPFPGVPFDRSKAIVPNRNGQVLTEEGSDVRGLFVTGWAKRGPQGIIGSNKPDALQTVAELVSTHAKGALPEPSNSEDIAAFLQHANVPFVTYDDWKVLDQLEIAAGQRQGRPREKFTSIPEMLEALAETREQPNVCNEQMQDQLAVS